MRTRPSRRQRSVRTSAKAFRSMPSGRRPAPRTASTTGETIDSRRPRRRCAGARRPRWSRSRRSPGGRGRPRRAAWRWPRPPGSGRPRRARRGCRSSAARGGGRRSAGSRRRGGRAWAGCALKKSFSGVGEAGDVRDLAVGDDAGRSSALAGARHAVAGHLDRGEELAVEVEADDAAVVFFLGEGAPWRVALRLGYRSSPRRRGFSRRNVPV